MNKLHSLKTPILSLDLKHNLIRIHKVTLSLLGDPDYIQILVNPDNQSIVIMKGNSKDHLAHHICYNKIKSGQSFELYSTVLLQNLKTISTHCEPNHAYRIYGTYISKHSIAQFSMNDLRSYDEERGTHE